MIAFDGPQGLDAVHSRHAYVENHQVCGVLREPGKSFLAAAYSGGLHVAFLHALDQGFAKIRLVIDEQHPEIAHSLPSCFHGRPG
jgi:hypothetical protein